MNNVKQHYKIYHLTQSVEELETLVQSWKNELIQENIALFKYQTIVPFFQKYF